MTIDMGMYRVLLATKTSIMLKPDREEYIFRAETFKFTLRRIKSEIDQQLSGIKYGWILEFEGESPDLSLAVSFATEMSEFFLSVLSLETSVESHKSIPILGYDISEGITERAFIQYFYNIPISRLQIADLETYHNHLEAVWGYEGKKKDRLYRSIRWFRKGLNEDDPLDQFLALWQGLETLNPLLAEHYECENGGKEVIEKKCFKTGQTYYDERTTKQGLERFVTEININKDTWKKISKLRNKIAHGFESFQNLYNDCILLIPALGKLLHDGISIILGFEYDERVSKHLSSISPIKIGDTQIIECKLHESDIKKIPKGYPHPYFTAEFEIEQFKEGERDGFRVRSTSKPFFNCGYTAGSFSVSGRGVDVELEEIE
ncbi:hypothetical protein AB4Z29_25195 [Paenibacillus sp. 2TAB23]|uniref:hypothetical protein n=1 Tax=Paenibacillus sp. 2TAB23 TaxID=3233004 RepID=UPI003F9AE2C3